MFQGFFCEVVYIHILLYVSWFIYCNIMQCVMIVLYGVMYSVVYIVQCGVRRLVRLYSATS